MEPGIQKRKDSDPSLRNCRAAAVNSCSQDLERGNSWSWEQFLYIMHGWEKSLFLWLASCPAFLREVRLFTFQLGRRTFHKFFPVILLELMLCERKVFFLLPSAAPLALTAVFPSISMASVNAPAAARTSLSDIIRVIATHLASLVRRTVQCAHHLLRILFRDFNVTLL